MHPRTWILFIFVLVCLHHAAECNRVDIAERYAEAQELLNRALAYAGAENDKPFIPINMWKINSKFCQLCGGIMFGYDELWCRIENKEYILLPTPADTESPELIKHLWDNGMAKITKESKHFKNFKVDFIESRYEDRSTVHSLLNLKELFYTQKNSTCVVFGKRGSKIEELLGQKFQLIKDMNDREGLKLLINPKSIKNFIIVYDDIEYSKLFTFFEAYDQLLPIAERKDLEDRCFLHYDSCPIHNITNDFLYSNDSIATPFIRFFIPTALWYNREKLTQYKASKNYQMLTQMHYESLAKLEIRNVSNIFDMVCSILAEKMNEELDKTASEKKMMYMENQLSSTEKAYKKTAEHLADKWSVNFHADIVKIIGLLREGREIDEQPVPVIGNPLKSHYCYDAHMWIVIIIRMLDDIEKSYYEFGTIMLKFVLVLISLMIVKVFCMFMSTFLFRINTIRHTSATNPPEDRGTDDETDEETEKETGKGKHPKKGRNTGSRQRTPRGQR